MPATNREDRPILGPKLRFPLGAGLAGVAVGLLGAAGATAAPPPCPVSLSPADESAMTALINGQRVAAGVKKVSTNPALRKAGRSQSRAMARGARFAHSTPMAWANGRAAAQNIAYAESTATAFLAMMSSEEHRDNLLGPTWKQSGVGAARNCTGTLFFTVNLLGKP